MKHVQPEKPSPPESTTQLTLLEAEAVERLRAATADLTSRALPNGVKIIKLGVEPAGAAIRIGVLGAWTADVVLDRLLLAEAFFVLLRFDIKVDSSPDALNDSKRGQHDSERSLPLTKDQQEPLRQMLDDRMRWATDSAEKGDAADRGKKALYCLAEAMSYECCGKLALHHIRAQCRSLVSSGTWSTKDVTLTKESEVEADLSLQIRYWERSSMADTVDISIGSKSSATSTDGVSVISVKGTSMAPGNDHLLNPASLDVERLLLRICGDRALEFMTNLMQYCNPIVPNFATMKISRCSTSAVSLILLLSGESPELTLSILLRTGGVGAKCGGIFSRLPASRSSHVRALKEHIWDGERIFSTKESKVLEVLREIVLKAVAMYEIITREATVAHDKSKKARHSAAPSSPKKNMNVRPSLKDGIPATALKVSASPHLAMQGKLTRRRNGEYFGEEQKGIIVRCSGNNQPLRLVKKIRYAGRTASSIAAADEAVHVKAIEKTRQMLIEEMRNLKVLTAPPSMATTGRGKSQVPIKTTPMETESSTLHVRSGREWNLRVILRRNIFDEIAPGGVVSFIQKTRTLKFSYHGFSKTTVNCFRKDLIRARIAAALATGLSADPGKFQIKHKTPTYVSVKVGDITLSAGLGRRSVEVEAHPPQRIITTQLIPLIEELLNDAGMEMGQRFGDLLDRSLPIGQAIQSIIPKDPKRFRVRFRTALRARCVILHPQSHARKHMTCGIDIDARAGRDRMLLVDVARADKLMSNNKSSSAASQFSPIPIWGKVLERLASKGKGRPMHSGAAVQIPSNLLGPVLMGTFREFQ